MNLIEFVQNNYLDMLTKTGEHLLLALISTAIAAMISIPLGIYISRHPAWKRPIIGIANVLQTIPSLALLGFLVPLPFLGGIRPRTAIVALVLYALLPLIRNTYVGISDVDSSVKEAGIAMGMTDRQLLFSVELPLASNVIFAGVRVAMVLSIGIATIAAYIGAGGLGSYIFRGIFTLDNTLILAGAVPAALLAILTDFILGHIEKRLAPKRA
jgi:osmoprotectant transport system permease protein